MKTNRILFLMLALSLGLGAGAQGLRALEARLGAKASENPYGIYPVPHSTQQWGETASVTETVYVIAEEGIDQYTIDRAVQVLEEHGKAPGPLQTSPRGGLMSLPLGGDGGGADGFATLRLRVDASLAAPGKYDRHNITIGRQEGTELAEIVIVGENTDATFYGLASLEQILDQDRDNIVCGEIQDYADVKNRGIIEGYYGVPYSAEVSRDLFRFMARYKLNMYMYGAKSDPYHSQKWADPYPTSITSEQRRLGYLSQSMLRDITSTAHQCKVNFIWAIHPGSAFTNANNTTVVSKIMTKFQNMYKLGVRQFGLCVDDVGIPTDDATLSLNASRVTQLQNLIDQKWNTSGAAPEDTVKPLNLVPQLYNFSQSTAENRQKFYAALSSTPAKVDVYITGQKTWTVPNSSDFQQGKSYLGREVSWWWNYPCNDQDVTKLFPRDTYTNFSLHPRISSSARLEADLQGAKTILINPMQQGEVSKIALFSVGNYTWNTAAFDNMASWEAALPAVVGREHAAALRLLAPYLCYFDASAFSTLAARFKTALGKSGVPTEEMLAEVQGILEACADLQTLETSERESDRLFYSDVRPWLLKLEAMAQEIVGLAEMVVSENDDAKWEAFVKEMDYVDSLGTDSRFAFDILTGMGSSIRLSTKYAEPAAEAMMPFVAWFSQNALGKDYFTNLIPTAPSFVGSREDMNGSATITTTGQAYIKLTKPVVMNPGDYVGISLPKAIRIDDCAVADTLGEHYEMLCSANGKQWEKIDLPLNGVGGSSLPLEHIKYVIFVNSSTEARYLKLSSTEFKLSLPQKLKPSSATTPQCSAGFYDGHTEKYMIDGDYTTWTCIRRNQQDGDAYTVRLGKATPIHDVRICMGTENGDYMTAGLVQISQNGSAWENLPISGTTDTNYTLTNAHNVKYNDEMTYCDFDGQGKTARFVRLYLSTPNTSNWLRLYEIEVNGRVYDEAYQGPAVDAKGMSIPELSDAEGSTCYTPTSSVAHSPSYIIWHLRSLQHAKALTIYRDGGQKTDAVVSIRTPQPPSGGATANGQCSMLNGQWSMLNAQWEELGGLSGYVSRFDLTSYPLAVAVKISWTSKAPLLYEITEETEAESNTITGIESIQNSKLKIQNANGAWYDLSGRKINSSMDNNQSSMFNGLKKGIYIHNGKVVIK